MAQKLLSIKYSDGLFCELRHGVQFGIWNPEVKLSIGDAEQYLASLMEHYKGFEEPYAGYYQYAYLHVTKHGKHIPGELQLLPPKVLRGTEWVEAIADAYSCVTTVQQILEAPQVWRDASERNGGDFRDVIKLPQWKSRVDLLALFMLIKRHLAKSNVWMSALSMIPVYA